MLSMENRVQLAAMVVGAIVAVGFIRLMPQPPGIAWLAAFLLVFYAITVGGPHLYLYRRGEGGAIPRSARGRFLLALALVLPLWVGAVVLREVTVADVRISLVLGALSALGFLGYFVNEMRHGYADFAKEADLR